MARFAVIMVTLTLTLASGCQRYERKPLLERQLIMKVQSHRHSVNPPADAGPITFSRLLELTSQHSPELQRVRAEHQTSLAIAGVKTPLANPSVEIGPKVGFGPDLGSSSRIAPFGSLGFSIPLGKRRKYQDALNQVSAAAANAEVAVRYRELYFDIRDLYIRLLAVDRLIVSRTKIAENAKATLDLTRKGIEGGTTTQLDVGLLDLEQARVTTEILTTRVERVDILGKLSRLVGLSSSSLQPWPDQPLNLPEKFPDAGGLRELLLLNHPQLARLRTQYEVADAQLRLEIARQYPDLRIGPSFDRETGERKNDLGLVLGIDIPLFDKNQQGITAAASKRDEIAPKYEAAANESLADLEIAELAKEAAHERLKVLKEIVLPKAEANVTLARRSLEVGATAALPVLEAERSLRAVAIEVTDAEFALIRASIALERSVGHPLLSLPGDTQQDVLPAVPLPDEQPTPQSSEGDQK